MFIERSFAAVSAMNVRSNTLQISCEGHQIAEVTAALLHSILFYRSYGKFNYKHEGSYSIGTLGYEEVKCDFIDFTYVRCASESLVERINKDVKDFVEKLRESDDLKGSLNLEFYCKRKGRMWPLNETPIIWEIWVLKIDCGSGVKSSETVEEALLEKLLTIIQIVNSSKCYLPQMPNRENVDTVFDTSHRDVQPYIYKIVHKIGNAGAVSQTAADFGPSSAAIKKLIKHTFYV